MKLADRVKAKARKGLKDAEQPQEATSTSPETAPVAVEVEVQSDLEGDKTPEEIAAKAAKRAKKRENRKKRKAAAEAQSFEKRRKRAPQLEIEVEIVPRRIAGGVAPVGRKGRKAQTLDGVRFETKITHQAECGKTHRPVRRLTILKGARMCVCGRFVYLPGKKRQLTSQFYRAQVRLIESQGGDQSELIHALHQELFIELPSRATERALAEAESDQGD